MTRLLNAARRLKKRLSHTRLVDVSRLHEAEERRALHKIFDSLDVRGVLDIGANKGGFALNALGAMPAPVPLVCVEPNAAVIARFEKAQAGNNAVSVMHVAISDKDANGVFHITANAEFSSLKRPQGAAGALQDKVAVTETIEIEMLTLDSLIERSFPSGEGLDLLVKLDTQGMDYDILRQSTSVTQRACCIITEVEFSGVLYGAKRAWTDHIAMVEAKGFALAALYPSNPGHFPDLYDMNAVFVNRALLAARAGQGDGA